MIQYFYFTFLFILWKCLWSACHLSKFSWTCELKAKYIYIYICTFKWIYLLWREAKGGSPQGDVFSARGSAKEGGWRFVDALMSVHHLVDLALPHIGEGVARRWWGEAWGNMGALVGDGADTGKWEGIREFRPPSASHWSHQFIRLLEGWGGVLWISYDNNVFLKEQYGYIITKHNWRLWNQPLFSRRKPFILQEVGWEVSRGELRAISGKTNYFLVSWTESHSYLKAAVLTDKVKPLSMSHCSLLID